MDFGLETLNAWNFVQVAAGRTRHGQLLAAGEMSFALGVCTEMPHIVERETVMAANISVLVRIYESLFC